MATTASAVTVVGGPLSGGGWRLSWPTTRLSSASTARTAREGEKRPSWAEKRTVLENFAAGDVATVLDALDLEVEWIEASQGSCLITTPTTDETEWSNGVFGPTFASFDEFALRIDRIHDAGGVVVFEGRVTGLTKADGRLDAPIAWLWTVRDGRIVVYHNNDLE